MSIVKALVGIIVCAVFSAVLILVIPVPGFPNIEFEGFHVLVDMPQRRTALALTVTAAAIPSHVISEQHARVAAVTVSARAGTQQLTNITPPQKVDGWFATNTILDEAEVYYESQHTSLESLAILDDDAIFTGDNSGAVFKITGKQIAQNITHLKYPCTIEADTNSGATCGWPLGMRFDKSGYLLVMDYFGGMTKVDVNKGSYENLIPKSRPINNKFGHTPEDVEIAENGLIYWTDGSTTGNFFLEMLAQPSGRLLRFDPLKRQNEVLLENLHFSNGLCLSDDEEFILVVETGRSSIKRYYLKGENKGRSGDFVDGLPGYPDNIRSNGRGGFYVALAAPWNDQYSLKIHLLAPRPLFRKLILRSRHILQNLISYLKKILSDNNYLNMIEKYVEEIEPVLNLGNLPKTGTIVELSKTGKIIGIMNGKSGSISGISQIVVGKNYAFLCSPFAGKVWRIKLDTLRRMQ